MHKLTTVSDLSSEDNKLVVLARAVLARAQTEEAAAVRDHTGRTYAAASLNLASLQLSGVAGCVVMAESSGIRELEAAVVLTSRTEFWQSDVALLAEFSSRPVTLFRGTLSGKIVESSITSHY
jgi:hypothetical protein